MFHVFIVELSVYEKYLPLTELGCSSLILTASKKISLILTFLIKNHRKAQF